MHCASDIARKANENKNSMLGDYHEKASLVWSSTPETVRVKTSLGNSTANAPPPRSQGLVHWMSVMAEHVTSSVTPQDVHYIWNGVDNKSGVTDQQQQHNIFHKAHIDAADDNRIETGHQGPSLPSSIYETPRSNSSNSSSPPAVTSAVTTSSLLVVPQPISAVAKSGGTPSLIASGRKYQCKMCPQIFGAKADLQLHNQMHMREAKPYKCSQCTKAFANSSYLSQHTRIHLGIKPYRCEICQRKFTQLSHLQQHIRTHTGDKPYKCRHPGCSKAFSQLSNLQSHSRCHQTDKPYKCNSCYKCFADEPSLLEHIPKHKESKHLKTHICQFCGKSYTQETYLTKHMQKHTDKRIGANNHPVHQSFPHSSINVTPPPNQQPPALNDNFLRSRSTALTEDLHRHHPYDHLPIGPGKTTSAFTPIQLPSRPFFHYESLPFSKPTHPPTSAEMKSPSGSFPNQLISLHQIRNYVHQPSVSAEHLLGLKNKMVQ